jgi:DNA-directed RNA polymerase subunit RPC12/RpoP
MLVRCGRCQAELEVPGAGEFVCPACGTRNAVRGASPAPSPFDLPDIGGRGAADAALQETAAGVTWVVCPRCSYRFAVGEVAQVDCPTCSASLGVAEGRVEVLSEEVQGNASSTANP